MTPGLDAYAASFQGELDRLARDLREGPIAAARRAVDAARTGFTTGVREIDTESAWTDESAVGTLRRLQGVTRERLTGPLAAALADLDLGLRLVDLSRDIELAARSLARPVPADGGLDPQELARRVFRRHVVDELLPGVVRVAAHDAAANEIEPFGRVTTALTHWTHTILDLEDRIAERARDEAESEAPGGEEARSPATAPATTPPAPVAGTGADGVHEEAPPEDSRTPVERARDRVRERYDELAAALGALVDSLAGEWVEAIAGAAADAVREAVETFDPEARPWRTAVKEVRERAERGEPEPPDAARPWSVEDALIPRFASEAGRIELCGELLGFDRFLCAFPRTHLLDSAILGAEAVCEQIRTAVAAIRELCAEAEAALPAEDEESEPQDLQRLRRRGRMALRKAEDGVAKALAEHEPDAGVQDGLRALFEYVSRIPLTLTVSPLVGEDETARVAAKPKRLEVREWAEEVLDTLVLDRLADAGAASTAALDAARAALPLARDVLEYNLGAAAETDELPPDGAAELQRELLFGGLTRSADRLEEAAAKLEAASEAALEAPRSALARTARRFRERVRAEGTLEGHARDAWQAARQGAIRTGARWGRALRNAIQSGLRLVRDTWRRLDTTVARARSAVGATPTEEGRADLTARTIADIDAAAEALPFVYRRLFSYRPLDDPELLVGRDRESAILERHLDEWETGSSDAVLLVGNSGVGVTSLLRSTRERWYGRVDWRDVPLDRRIEDENAWAAMLGRTLELDPVPASLAEIEERLAARETPSFPLVCAIENLEHLYFRGVLSQGLLAPTLKLLSATDTNVLWITSLPASAWQVIRATDPGLSALLRVIAVTPLGRADIETAILTRHNRSGISLEWEATDGLPLSARRALARAESDDERQEILRSAYFERLFDLSEGYVALALLYWMRSIAPEEDGDRFIVQWPTQIDFAAWDDLHSDAGFALRAFLEHGTLTLTEYARLFGVGETIAFATFERLGSLLVIEPAGEVRRLGTPLVFRRVERGKRYRIRPVLVRPVERLLEARRLFY